MTIGDMIARDFRTSALFLGYRIDLLTERDKTIETVCKEKNINLLHLLDDLNGILTSSRIPPSDYSLWPIGLLTDMISIRNRYVKENLPVIQQFLDRISEIHEGHDQCIVDLCSSFNFCAERLIGTLERQLPLLFSSTAQLTDIAGQEDVDCGTAFENVSGSIRTMTEEFSVHKRNFLSVVTRINRYVPPLNACGSYKISLDLLTELQNDLYKIIGLQNVLYNRMMAMGDKRVMELIK